MSPIPTRYRRPRSLSIEHLEPRLALSGGLSAQYFHNVDFTGLAGTRTEVIAHDWGTESPGFGVAADGFSVRWTGQLEAEFSELYTFRVVSDEGVRLWIDGELVIDDWEPHTARARFATKHLVAGQRYDLRVDYFEGSGPARIELSWASASQPMQVIPAERLFESPAGVLGTYRDEAGGSLSRVDATIDFDWGGGSPGPGITADHFQVSWTGLIRADFGEDYRFSTISDDGVRLWIGGELVIDNWTLHAATEDFGTKWLEPGKWYDFRLDYFEHAGAAQIELRWSSSQQTGEGEFEIVPQENLRAMMPAVFRNPLGAGADPWVFSWDGNYYMSRSQGNSVWINRAESLQDIHHSSPRSDTTVAWSAPPGTNYSAQIWAPEIHRMGSNWYIYVAASDGNNQTHRMHVMERKADDPFGPYEYLGQITMPTDRWAIDGTVFQWEGVWYFVWSGWPGFSDGVQNLYIAQMRNPWTIQGDRVLISTPQFAWEQHGLAINEGPQILIHDGHLHIIYSASGYWTPQYALGRLTYNGTGSLLDPQSWEKSPEPVFQRTSQVVGTGHGSFVQTADETEYWHVYHAHANPTQFTENRVIRMQPFTFRSDGTPDFGEPLPNDHWLPVPSAGPQPERPDLDGDFDADGRVDMSDYGVWRSTFGASVFPGSGADATGTGVVDASAYTVWRDNLGAEIVDGTASVAALQGSALVETTVQPSPNPGAVAVSSSEAPSEYNGRRAHRFAPSRLEWASSTEQRSPEPHGNRVAAPVPLSRSAGAVDEVLAAWVGLSNRDREWGEPLAPRPIHSRDQRMEVDLVAPELLGSHATNNLREHLGFLFEQVATSAQ